MLENATIARPYATAIFEQARDTGQMAEWSDMLALLSLLASDADMRKLIFNPKIAREQLRKLVLDVCGAALSELGQNLVSVLIQAGRLQYTPYIRDLYEQMRADAEGKAEVEIVTAYPLDEQQQERLGAAMAARLGRRVNITTAIDKSLIGGAIIRAGDSIIDASLRGRLTELHNELI